MLAQLLGLAMNGDEEARLDQSQKDLKPDAVSGLDQALKVIKNIEGIEVCTLTSKDVVRHHLVQKIVEAYEVYDKKEASKNKTHYRNYRKDN